MRARFRRSFEKPEPVVPGEVNEYTIDLHWSHHCFRKGHKIMVQVQSTWFPLVDRNPQKYVPNIFEAKDDDFQSARSPDNRYRTAPLKGLFSHTKGGFYHDGRFAAFQPDEQRAKQGD